MSESADIENRSNGFLNMFKSVKMTESIRFQHKPGFCALFALSILGSIIPFLFILGFSGIGFGLDVVKFSQDYLDEARIEIFMISAFLFFMHVFDSQFWPTSVLIFCWSSVFACICIALCLLVAVVPYAPICIFTILVPLSIFGIKNTFFPDVPANVLVGWNYKVYVYMASIILVAFFAWCSIDGNMWDSPTNAEYSHRAGCAVDFTYLEECENEDVEGVPCFYDEYYENVEFSEECTSRCLGVYRACEEAFIIWSFPGLASMSLFVMGFISKYLENPKDPHANHHISAVAKFCAVFLFLFWIFASLAGAGEGLSSSLIAFAVSMFVGSAIVFSVVFWNSLKENGRDDIIGGVAKQVESYVNVVRGLAVLAFTPLILVYVLLSMVNQLVRRHFVRFCCRKRVSDAEYEHNGYFTLAVTKQIDDFMTWDHAEVLSYAVYWGVGYVFLNVLASKFTTVFLSWLISYTSEMNLLAVTGIVIAVGMVLFMLPPIPGLPIYLTGGIVLVSVGRENLGLWVSIAYACFVSLFLKLLACTVQQKLIGGSLGGNIAVKQMVAINSDGIRAMRVMLSDPGITKRKVAVLVGGPDWPVSVLCGILGLDLFPILMGTLPVVALIVPTVFCGSFAFMGSIVSDDGVDLYPWAETMGAVASAVAAGFMLYFSLSAATNVKITLDKDKDLIDAIPLDEAVRDADQKSAETKVIYRRVTVWNSLPLTMKLSLLSSVIAMMGCCFFLVVFNAQCFREYDLMYTISQNLGGNWTNIVLPLGRVALLLFAVSSGLLYTFESWATKKANAMSESMDESGVTALTSTIVPSYSTEA